MSKRPPEGEAEDTRQQKKPRQDTDQEKQETVIVWNHLVDAKYTLVGELDGAFHAAVNVERRRSDIKFPYLYDQDILLDDVTPWSRQQLWAFAKFLRREILDRYCDGGNNLTKDWQKRLAEDKRFQNDNWPAAFWTPDEMPGFVLVALFTVLEYRPFFSGQQTSDDKDMKDVKDTKESKERKRPPPPRKEYFSRFYQFNPACEAAAVPSVYRWCISPIFWQVRWLGQAAGGLASTARLGSLITLFERVVNPFEQFPSAFSQARLPSPFAREQVDRKLPWWSTKLRPMIVWPETGSSIKTQYSYINEAARTHLKNSQGFTFVVTFEEREAGKKYSSKRYSFSEAPVIDRKDKEHPSLESPSEKLFVQLHDIQRSDDSGVALAGRAGKQNSEAECKQAWATFQQALHNAAVANQQIAVIFGRAEDRLAKEKDDKIWLSEKIPTPREVRWLLKSSTGHVFHVTDLGLLLQLHGEVLLKQTTTTIRAFRTLLGSKFAALAPSLRRMMDDRIVAILDSNIGDAPTQEDVKKAAQASVSLNIANFDLLLDAAIEGEKLEAKRSSSSSSSSMTDTKDEKAGDLGADALVQMDHYIREWLMSPSTPDSKTQGDGRLKDKADAVKVAALLTNKELGASYKFLLQYLDSFAVIAGIQSEIVLLRTAARRGPPIKSLLDALPQLNAAKLKNEYMPEVPEEHMTVTQYKARQQAENRETRKREALLAKQGEEKQEYFAIELVEDNAVDSGKVATSAKGERKMSKAEEQKALVQHRRANYESGKTMVAYLLSGAPTSDYWRKRKDADRAAHDYYGAPEGAAFLNFMRPMDHAPVVEIEDIEDERFLKTLEVLSGKVVGKNSKKPLEGLVLHLIEDAKGTADLREVRRVAEPWLACVSDLQKRHPVRDDREFLAGFPLNLQQIVAMDLKPLLQSAWGALVADYIAGAMIHRDFGVEDMFLGAALCRRVFAVLAEIFDSLARQERFIAVSSSQAESSSSSSSSSSSTETTATDSKRSKRTLVRNSTAFDSEQVERFGAELKKRDNDFRSLMQKCDLYADIVNLVQHRGFLDRVTAASHLRFVVAQLSDSVLGEDATDTRLTQLVQIAPDSADRMSDGMLINLRRGFAYEMKSLQWKTDTRTAILGVQAAADATKDRGAVLSVPEINYGDVKEASLLAGLDARIESLISEFEFDVEMKTLGRKWTFASWRDVVSGNKICMMSPFLAPKHINGGVELAGLNSTATGLAEEAIRGCLKGKVGQQTWFGVNATVRSLPDSIADEIAMASGTTSEPEAEFEMSAPESDSKMQDTKEQKRQPSPVSASSSSSSSSSSAALPSPPAMNAKTARLIQQLFTDSAERWMLDEVLLMQKQFIRNAVEMGALAYVSEKKEKKQIEEREKLEAAAKRGAEGKDSSSSRQPKEVKLYLEELDEKKKMIGRWHARVWNEQLRDEMVGIVAVCQTLIADIEELLKRMRSYVITAAGLGMEFGSSLSIPEAVLVAMHVIDKWNSNKEKQALVKALAAGAADDTVVEQARAEAVSATTAQNAATVTALGTEELKRALTHLAMFAGSRGGVNEFFRLKKENEKDLIERRDRICHSFAALHTRFVMGFLPGFVSPLSGDASMLNLNKDKYSEAVQRNIETLMKYVINDHSHASGTPMNAEEVFRIGVALDVAWGYEYSVPYWMKLRAPTLLQASDWEFLEAEDTARFTARSTDKKEKFKPSPSFKRVIMTFNGGAELKALAAGTPVSDPFSDVAISALVNTARKKAVKYREDDIRAYRSLFVKYHYHRRHLFAFFEKQQAQLQYGHQDMTIFDAIKSYCAPALASLFVGMELRQRSALSDALYNKGSLDIMRNRTAYLTGMQAAQDRHSIDEIRRNKQYLTRCIWELAAAFNSFSAASNKTAITRQIRDELSNLTIQVVVRKGDEHEPGAPAELDDEELIQEENTDGEDEEMESGVISSSSTTTTTTAASSSSSSSSSSMQVERRDGKDSKTDRDVIELDGGYAVDVVTARRSPGAQSISFARLLTLSEPEETTPAAAATDSDNDEFEEHEQAAASGAAPQSDESEESDSEA